MIPFVLAVSNIAAFGMPTSQPAIYRPAIDTYVIDDLFIDPQIRIDGSGYRALRLSASLMKGAE